MRLEPDFAIKNDPNNDLTSKLDSLESILSNKPLYWYLATEVNHLQHFYKKINEKSLVCILNEIRELPNYYKQTNAYSFVWPSIKEFINEYFNNGSHHAVINTPTGSGKSVIAELAIAQNLENGSVLYLAPTNALCSQVSKNLKKKFSGIRMDDIQVVFGREEYSKYIAREFKILVTTPEKALIFLKLDKEVFKNCNLLVFDECHLLNDNNRGITAEIVISLLLNLNSNIKFIFMSAMMENPHSLSNWLERITKKPVAIIASEWKPTRIARFLTSIDLETKEKINKNEFTVNLSLQIDTESPWNQYTETLITQKLPLKLIGKSKTGELRFVNQASRLIAQKLEEKNYRTMLLVVLNKGHVFSIAENWNNENKFEHVLDDYELSLKQIIEIELGTESLPIEILLGKKIAVYSSAMLDSEQSLCLRAFSNKEKNVKTIIATESLSQGMNLEIDSVVIAGTTRVDNNVQKDLNHEILNAMGRAARANYKVHGLSFIVPTSWISNKLNKSELIAVSNCIEKKDASTEVVSRLTGLVSKIALNESIGIEDEDFISALPNNNVLRGSILRNTFGTYMLNEEIITKCNKLIDSYLVNIIEKSKVPSWALEATSITNLPLLEGVWLFKFITEKSNFNEPIFSYVDWVLYLIEYIFYAKTVMCKKILEESYKFRIGEVLNFRNDKNDKRVLCDEIKNTFRLWINGGNYIDIAQSFNFSITERNKTKRSSPKDHPLPQVFKWKNKIPSDLSRLGGLLFAIQDYWIKNSPETIPYFLLDHKSLSSLSLAIKFGINSPEALACYENIIRERKASIYLSNLYDNTVDSPYDWEERYKYSVKLRNLLRNERITRSDPYLQSIITIMN